VGKVFVTGVSGFIGKIFLETLVAHHIDCVVLVRKFSSSIPSNVCQVIGDLSNLKKTPQKFLEDVDVVVHLAGKAESGLRNFDQDLRLCRSVNRDGTLNLAESASLSGVKRFIFLSSAKVCGESTPEHKPFGNEAECAPFDAYAISKYEAENGLLCLSETSNMDVVIIRPPIVYGPGSKGNFRSLISLVKARLPLPLANIKNKRSFLAIDNLVSFLILCADIEKSANAANEIFFVTDDEDVSTSELISKISTAFKIKVVLFYLPLPLLNGVARLLGKKVIVDRLLGNLQLDITKAKLLLGWYPYITMDQQLKKLAKFDKEEM